MTIAHGGLLFPPDIPQNSANIDLPAKPPSLFPKSSCSLCPSNYKGIRSAEFHSFSRFSRPGVRSCEALASSRQRMPIVYGRTVLRGRGSKRFTSTAQGAGKHPNFSDR